MIAYNPLSWWEAEMQRPTKLPILTELPDGVAIQRARNFRGRIKKTYILIPKSWEKV